MTTAAIYLRTSLDATGEELGVKRHREDALKLLAAREWTLAREYVDNSISSEGRKFRPAYDAMCMDYDAGRFDALIAWDLDRLTRQPRELIRKWMVSGQAEGVRRSRALPAGAGLVRRLVAG